MKALRYIVIFLAAFPLKLALAGYLPNPQTRGVWISQSYLTGGVTGIETMIRNLSNANINVIYVEVYTHGETIFPSAVMQNAGGIIQNPTFAGTDPLKTVIDVAHKYGIQVFAWFASPFLLSQSSDPTQVPSILLRHPEWTAVPRDTSDNFFPPNGGYGYSFGIDPSIAGAANFVIDLETECARNYPDIDGIETDIENDTTGWYGDSTRALFMMETGSADPLTLPPTDRAWFAWRQLQVTKVVRRIYGSVKSVNPKCVVSAAVPPPYMSSYSLENWSLWTDSGYVDAVEPMLYLSSGSFGSELSVCRTYVPNGFEMFPGVDISTAGSFSNALNEMKDAVAGDPGLIIWYYGYLLSSPGSFATLKSDLFTVKTLPSFDDIIIDNYGAGEFHTTGSWSTERGGLGGYGGTYLSAAAVPGDTAIFSQRIFRSGSYDLYGYWPGDSSSNCADVVVQAVTNEFSNVDTIDEKFNISAWHYIENLYLNSGETVNIKLYGNDVGNLIANAFRLRRANQFLLSDYAVQDSQIVLLKFSNPLLTPVPQVTSVFTSLGKSNISFFVDPLDNTILHVVVPPLPQGKPFTMYIGNLVDESYDTLKVSQVMDYDPDSTTLVADDQTSNSFMKLSGVWIQDTSYSAINGEYWLSRQGSQISKVEWGPIDVTKDGYYNVYAHIPNTQLQLSGRCAYVVENETGGDSVYASQDSGNGGWINLGNFPFSPGEESAVFLSSLPGASTSQYVVADAVMLTRSVEITGVKKPVEAILEKFALSNNYPNPFNPTTTVDISLPESGIMSLNIYNVLGQLIKVVDGGYKSAGDYNYLVNMDGFASGVYFYRLQQGSDVITKKMELLK